MYRNVWAHFVRKIVNKKLKIAQSGHTGGALEALMKPSKLHVQLLFLIRKIPSNTLSSVWESHPHLRRLLQLLLLWFNSFYQ